MTRTPRPWIPHRPEQRLSIWVSRLLDDGLVPPFYATANQDADHGGRTDQQRARDRARGVKPGQLDWRVYQGARYAEFDLKVGKNTTSDNQDVTIGKVRAAGGVAFAAWSLREVVDQLAGGGFRFLPNIETTLQRHEANLAASDREAEAILSGAVVKKRAAVKPRAKVTGQYRALAQRLRAKGVVGW